MNPTAPHALRCWLLTLVIIAVGPIGISPARAAQAVQAAQTKQLDDTVTVRVLLLELAVSELDKLYTRLEEQPLSTVFPDLTQDSQSTAEAQADATLPTAAWNKQMARQPVTLGVLSPQAAFDVIQIAKGNQYSNIMTAPSLKLVYGQDGTVSDITTRDFVTGYEADVAQPDRYFPQKTNVVIGTTLRVNVQRTVDGRFQLTGVSELSELKGVKQTIVRAGPARGRELQIPEMAYRVVRFNGQLPPQQSLLIDTGFVQTPAVIEAQPRGFGFFTKAPDKPVNRDTSLFLLLSVE